MATFQRATKRQSRLRLALIGPSGSGKTYSALAIGAALGSRIAVIDTEHGSAAKYATADRPFDVLEMVSFDPRRYVEAIEAAGREGYDVLIIDSLSHAWMGKDGALEQVDRAAKRSGGNSFAGWRDVTPMHNALVEAILASPCHVIATMRTKTEYIVEKDPKTGKSAPRKVGLQPVQRDGLEYEFDVVGDMDLDHNLLVGKTRCPVLDGAMIARPGREIAETLLAWLSDGAPHTEAPPRQLADTARTAEEVRQSFTDDPTGTGADVPPTKGPEPKAITDKQAKRLFAIAKAASWSDDELRFYLQDGWGYTSSRAILMRDYEGICTALETVTLREDVVAKMQRLGKAA